jgi:hypothetical protein
MNLAILAKMVRDGDLSLHAASYLVACRGECEALDYKESLNLDNDRALADFAKDVLGMKNVGGGYLVVGIRDKTWEFQGLPAALPYDAKILRDKIRKATGLDLDVNIVHHLVPSDQQLKRCALVLVRSARKRSKLHVPSLVARDFCPTQHFGLRRGEIYARKGDETVRVDSGERLRELLDEIETLADEAQLATADAFSPFAISDGTYRLLEKGYDQFVGHETLREQVLTAVTKDPRIWIINIHGPGGVGKSALANWAAHHFYEKRSFEAILHLTGKDTALLSAGISHVSRSLYSLENLLDRILETFEEPVGTVQIAPFDSHRLVETNVGERY